MPEIISSYVDGKLVVYEDRRIAEICVISGARYIGSGVPVRIGLLKKVEKVIAIDNSWRNDGVITLLGDVTPKDDYIYVQMRRGDVGPGYDPSLISGLVRGVSGNACAVSSVGNLFSGKAWMGEAQSGALISGIRIYATVIGY